ncbi:hypothetical protein FISHEDRAFT_73945 [Fistulina hepatica ATCC 64428]|uniref:Uncharacterized protein n=1 Tax=Fistulina hepatica ATCC 64428 TaxID=1128425 RepID=A0A0D7AAU0_9AGAR|nr:hypothetical protein FISHEDRAFT_73945 [Fistulina hepatica ATCC 64428]
MTNGLITGSREMPPDILCSIISYCIPRNYASLNSDLNWIRATTHVCKYWRDVALAYSSLWSNIIVSKHHWTDVMLSRSRNTPLTIMFDLPNTLDNHESMRFQSIIITNVSRLRDLQFSGHFRKILQFLDCLPRFPLPLLDTLYIAPQDTTDIPWEPAYVYNPYSFLGGIFARDAPICRLRDLQLCPALFPEYLPHSSKQTLTRLSLDGCEFRSPREAIELLQMIPLLQELELCHILLDRDTPSHPHAVESSFRRLTSVKLTADAKTCLLLSSLFLPTLSVLHLCLSRMRYAVNKDDYEDLVSDVLASFPRSFPQMHFDNGRGSNIDVAGRLEFESHSLQRPLSLDVRSAIVSFAVETETADFDEEAGPQLEYLFLRFLTEIAMHHVFFTSLVFQNIVGDPSEDMPLLWTKLFDHLPHVETLTIVGDICPARLLETFLLREMLCAGVSAHYSSYLCQRAVGYPFLDIPPRPHLPSLRTLVLSKVFLKHQCKESSVLETQNYLLALFWAFSVRRRSRYKMPMLALDECRYVGLSHWRCLEACADVVCVGSSFDEEEPFRVVDEREFISVYLEALNARDVTNAALAVFAQMAAEEPDFVKYTFMMRPRDISFSVRYDHTEKKARSSLTAQ